MRDAAQSSATIVRAGGEFFKPHRDGGQACASASDPARRETSFVTLMVYLNDSRNNDGMAAEDFGYVGGGLVFLSTLDARLPGHGPSANPCHLSRIKVAWLSCVRPACLSCRAHKDQRRRDPSHRGDG